MKRVVLHLLLWALYAAVEFLVNLPHTSDSRELLLHTLFYLPVIALPFYFVAYYLIPRLLWQGHKLVFWISCAVVLFLVMLLRLYWTSLDWYIWSGDFMQVPLSKMSKNLVRDYAVIGFAVALKIIRDWDKKDRLATQLQHEKRHAELQFLRAQIHPHFLFNTLNNLYGLALKQSPHTPDSILRLSGLLDFILYECNTEQIPLEKEIQLIQDYIELEKLRFDERLQLEFKHDQPTAATRIAPLLLLPLVENAFKHGASAANDAVFISINLRLDGKKLYFQVENSVKQNGRETEKASKGIGLRNIEKRLELLYPGKYNLQKIASEEHFLVSLQLDL